MKNYKQILEAINRGIKLALDDYEELANELIVPLKDIIKNSNSIKFVMDNSVDLGLPSRTLWCKYNLGCDSELLNNDPKHTKPNDWYGNYYAWGETNSRTDFSLKTYKFRTDDELILTKYNNKKLVELELVDDAAYNDPKYPSKFRMPTKEQFEELINYTDNKWISGEGEDLYFGVKGLAGMLFVSKINKNQIFIPASGYYNGLTLTLINEGGFLWTTSLFKPWLKNSLLFKTVFKYAHSVYFNYYSVDLNNISDRWEGMPIRPIINR